MDRWPSGTGASRSSTSAPAGDQPMTTADGIHTLTYNGEIYNFRELRAELEALGHRFRSRTDTEVVLDAYAEWGLEARRAPQRHVRVRGLGSRSPPGRRSRATATASSRSTTHSAADRCCSPPRSRRCCAIRTAAPSSTEDALLEYFTFQNFFTDRTLFAGVRSCSRRLHADGAVSTAGRREHPEQYWDFEFEEPDSRRATPRSTRSELDRLFRQAVGRQLVSDVPVGSYLSGRHGLRLGHRRWRAQQMPGMRTFTVGFDLSSASGLELGFDERSQAEHDVVPVRHRALRDGAEGRRHGARHAATSCGTSRSRASGRATRTSTRRSSPASS